ncbi:MAG: hypothetical protein ACRECF_09450, partial [Methyloceanibacter sp.]
MTDIARPKRRHTIDALGIPDTHFDAYGRAIKGLEGADYGQMGGSSGRFAGAYQMGDDEIGETADYLGVPKPSREQFLSDSDMQDEFFDAYTALHHQSLMKRSQAYRNLSPEDQLKALGYAHNQGAGGASKYLRTGKVGSDAFGTAGTAYWDAVGRELSGGGAPMALGPSEQPEEQDFAQRLFSVPPDQQRAIIEEEIHNTLGIPLDLNERAGTLGVGPTPETPDLGPGALPARNPLPRGAAAGLKTPPAFLAKHGLGYVYNPQKGRGKLEYWPADETGTPEHPRPGSLPLGQAGIEVYDPSVTELDVLGDVTSHHLIKTDPKVADLYQRFEDSLSPDQEKRLKQQYEHAKKNFGETRPYAQWREMSGVPGYFRGYPFKQWPAAAIDKAYTPAQKKLLDETAVYVGADKIGAKPDPYAEFADVVEPEAEGGLGATALRYGKMAADVAMKVNPATLAGSLATKAGEKIVEDLTAPPDTGDPAMFGFKVRDQLNPIEDALFKANPKTTGMAADDGHVILNPYSPLKDAEKAAVAKNEAFRLAMRKYGSVPRFDLTPAQKASLKGTAYEQNEDAAKATIAARIYSGDPSAKDATPEQKQWVKDFTAAAQRGDSFIGAISDPQQYGEFVKQIVPGVLTGAGLAAMGAAGLDS